MENKRLTFAIKTISDNFNLTTSEGYVNLMHRMLKLSDAQINKAVDFFLSQEVLSKMPSLMQWKKAAGVCDGNPIELACQKFLDKVQVYLTSDFIGSDEKREFNNGLSEMEYRALNSLGGISSLWSDLHQDGYKRSLSRILYELKQEFLNSATESNILAKPQSSNNALYGENVKTLLENTVKRLN